jgi:ADP-heptose:LPS heptosyltransferase
MGALSISVDRSDLKNIAVLRALQLGDMLNAVPALRALRAALPNSRITLVGLAWEHEFVKRFHNYLDEFILFPGIPGFPEQPADLARFPAFLREMQARRFDLAIQMQGSGDIANTVISLWGATYSAGFYTRGQYCPDPSFFLEYPEGEAEVWRHLRLMEFLGIPLQGDELEFPLFEEDWKEFEQLQRLFQLQKKYICIHPGSRKSERRWSVENFAALADGLAARGFQIVLTGSKEESRLTAATALNMKTPAIDLAGKTSLGGLGALISKACLVVSNDTGISHVATAVKTPSVILFSVPDMDRWAPKNKQLHRVLWPAMSLSAADVLTQAENHLQGVYAGGGLSSPRAGVKI